MPELSIMDALQPERVRLERVAYHQWQVMTVDDMVTDQQFFQQKLRRHNRFMHGWGVVAGLAIVPAPTEELPWQVRVEPGYALGPYGDEIFVGAPVLMDLAKFGAGAATDPCGPGILRPGTAGAGNRLFLAVKYAECRSRPVRTMAAGCGCEEERCEYSRIRDSFAIECLAELPPSHQPVPGQATLCQIVRGGLLPACPPCPAEPWVVLARIDLPASPTTAIQAQAINNTAVRRLVFSTAALQEQLIACCCGAADLRLRVQAPARVQARQLPFTLRVDNRGPDPATNVVVRVQLTPAGGGATIAAVSDFAATQGTWTETDPARPLVAEVGDLASGAAARLEFVLVGTDGEYESHTEATSGVPDPEPKNNTVATRSRIQLS